VSDDVLELLAACVQKGELHNTFGHPYLSEMEAKLLVTE
jgi:hypothetical protein